MKKLLELLKNTWFKGVIKTFIERIPLLNKLFAFLNGYKAIIGRILMFVAALLTFLQSSEGFPELFQKYAFLNDINEIYLALSGYILTELGLQHQTLKNMEDEGVVSDTEL